MDLIRPRIVFLEKLAEMFHEQNLTGNVAEGGTFQADFAKEMNRVFPQKICYLFDSFEGFDERDVLIEKKMCYSKYATGHLNMTTEDLVLSKLPHPEKCVIKKGYFPETTAGLEDETFCFVNLDFDLYKPTLAGLEFFASRMVKGGIILIHDYFSEGYKGVKQAVIEFAAANKQYFPIGDGLSVAFQF